METRKQEPRSPRHIHSLFSRFFFAAPFRCLKWHAASCLMASRFLVFSFFGVVLARFFFPQFSIMDSKSDSKAVQRSALCRSRRELSNEYLLAKFGFDTAENEPCKVCPLSVYRSPRFTLRKRLHRLHRMGARRSRYYLICSALISAPNRFKFHEISSELQ